MTPLTVGDESSPEDASALRDALHAFNYAKTGFSDGRTLACYVRESDGTLAAGIDGFSWGGYARIEYLWVAESERRRGLGSALVRAVIEEARARGCATVAVSSHTFQAPAFYEGLGFVEVGRTVGTPRGFDEVTYQLALDGVGLRDSR
jgi:ribosomal protein S18 acetylase RimI-like enzyme